MEIGTVISCTLGPNRDGTTVVRLAMCMVSGPLDIRTVQIVGDHDHNPVPGAKVKIEEIESAWEVGTILEDVPADATTLPGDKVYAANLPGGSPVATATIALRAVPNSGGGQIELGGTTDWAVAYTDMKLAFDTLKAELNAAVAVFNAHLHPAGAILDSVSAPCTGSTAPTVTPATPAVADMTAAQVLTVNVP